jgi:hypothetical protein
MKFNRIRTLAIATLGFVAACGFAKPVSAQGYAGTFTLPVEVRWQNATLPAGEYTFSMASSGFPCTVIIRGKDNAAVVMSVGKSDKVSGETSELVIERRGHTRFVREMYLAEIGLHLRYAVPSREKEELLAQGPATTEYVPLSRLGK